MEKKLTNVPKKFKDIYVEFLLEQEQEEQKERELEELIPLDKREQKRQEKAIQDVLIMVFGKYANW